MTHAIGTGFAGPGHAGGGHAAAGHSSWRVVLQRELSAQPQWTCETYDVPGVGNPARIQVVGCDSAADGHASATCDAVYVAIKQMGGVASLCCGTNSVNCKAWTEPACRQLLVLIVGRKPLDPQFEVMTAGWLARSPHATVIPALLPSLSHKDVFGSNQHPELSKRTISNWGGDATRLAREILENSLLDSRPSVFLSYTRSDASDAADAITDALGAVGYQVYLDRRLGGVGHHFPSELRQEIANRDLVLLLESPNVGGSLWTRWEAALAARYHVGPAAVHFTNGAKLLSTRFRLSLNTSVSTTLTQIQLDGIVAFAREKLVGQAAMRRAYFETLVEQAASSHGGTVSAGPNGSLSVRNRTGAERGNVVVSGVPGRLRHAHRLSGAPPTAHKLLAGDHAHLSPQDAADLVWLSRVAGISLTGKAAVYSTIRSIL